MSEKLIDEIAEAFEAGFKSYKPIPHKLLMGIFKVFEESEDRKKIDLSLFNQWAMKVGETFWSPLALDKTPSFDPKTEDVCCWGSTLDINTATMRDFERVKMLGEMAARHLHQLCYQYEKRFAYFPPEGAETIVFGCGLSMKPTSDLIPQVYRISWCVNSVLPLFLIRKYAISSTSDF